MKKVKIKILNSEKLEFQIDDNSVENGDYFSLKEINEIDFSTLNDEINLRKDKIFEEKLQEQIEIEKMKFEHEFKNSVEFLELKKLKEDNLIKIQKLEHELNKNKENKENEIIIAQNKIKEELNEKINQLTNQIKINEEIKNKDIEVEKSKISESLNLKINQLSQTLEQEKEKKANEIIIAQSRIKEELNEKINYLTNQIKTIEDVKNRDIEINNLKNKEEKDAALAKIIEEKDAILAKITEEKNTFYRELEILRTKGSRLNIKRIGEELENEIQTMYSNQLSHLENIKWGKTTDVGEKPDFFFEILADDGSRLSKIIIEAKSENPNSSTKKKNKDHYEKLSKDTKKYHGDYSILVSELETEDRFYIKRVSEYENMYVVRPEFFTNFMHILYKLEISKKQLHSEQINFKAKQEILDEFETMKNELINNSISNIRKNLEAIEKDADVIQKKSSKIIANAQKALGVSNLKTIETKLQEFKIKKIVKNIEKVEN